LKMASKQETVPLQPKKELEDVKYAIVALKERSATEFEKLKTFLWDLDPTLRLPAKKMSNPAALGLGGFGCAVLMFQVKNMGLINQGPTAWVALVLGGLMQVFAGLQEFKTGNNFGYAAFSCFGGLWTCFGLIGFCKEMKYFPVTQADMGVLLIIFTLFTFIFLYPAAKLDMVLFLMFFDLFLAFVVGDVAHFMDLPDAKPVETTSAVLFMIGGLLALYIMAHIIYLDVFKRDLLPVGQAPMLKWCPRLAHAQHEQV
ncbi:Inner membrane protein YaaH, partial [Trichinella spiralis]